MSITRVYFDMDGVVADWTLQAALTIFKRNPASGSPMDIAALMDNGSEIADFLPASTFWPYTADSAWWENIPDVFQRFDAPSAPRLWELAADAFPGAIFTFLTALPFSTNHSAADGKMRWLKARFGEKFNDAILCPKRAKADVAGQDRLLIDDDLDNVRHFTEAGGAAILYDPRRATEDALRHAMAHVKPGEWRAL